MLTLLLYCAPTILYVIWRERRGDDRAAAIRDAGAVPGTGSDYAQGLALLVPVALVGWLALLAVPVDVRASFGARHDVLAPLPILLVLASASGREILFRGLVGGVLMRRLGRWPGNLAQALLSAVPALSLLANDVRLWPVLAGQVVTGVLLGWLRARLGSCFPGIPASGLGAIIASVLAAPS